MTRQTYTSSKTLRSHFTKNSISSTREHASVEFVPNALPQTKNNHSGLWSSLAAVVAVTGIAGVVTLRDNSLWVQQPPLEAPVAQATPIAPLTNPPTRTGLTPEEVYRKTSSAVVTISTPKGSHGSGVFINQSGTLLTNEHVVERFSMVQVRMFNRQSATGRVIRVDKANDLAVVQLEPALSSNCLPIEATALKTGQVVYALGSPLQMEQTFTNGVVSRHNETGEVLHTAPIAPGSSGSPLLNDRGHIVGINRAVITEFQAMSIAIPNRVIHQLNMASHCNS